ncbi:MAG TPA: hypothetical protein VF098_10245 [Sphingomicrobium sp.]|jgi:hypothetical protein
MKWILAIALLALGTAASATGRRAVLHDPVTLNIGVNCQWQPTCMAKQRAAMNSALTYVARHKPPRSQIQLCNRNASRGGVRMDWIGYDHCIRNRALKRRR